MKKKALGFVLGLSLVLGIYFIFDGDPPICPFKVCPPLVSAQ